MRCCSHACSEAVVRFTMVLSKKKIAEGRRLAPKRMRSHLGCILVEALDDWIVKKKREAFDRGVARMAADEEFLKAMAAPYPRPGRRVRRKL